MQAWSGCFFYLSERGINLANSEFDTIAAISTPVGEGGISIIRISGEEALPIAQVVFKGKDLSKVDSHTINYGHVIDPGTQTEVDEVMASVMLAPKSQTPVVLKKAIRAGESVVLNNINDYGADIAVKTTAK